MFLFCFVVANILLCFDCLCLSKIKQYFILHTVIFFQAINLLSWRTVDWNKPDIIGNCFELRNVLIKLSLKNQN